MEVKNPMEARRTIPCPICRKPVALGDPELPFCSKRCRLIDLGKWADEEYRISSPAKDFDAEQQGPGSDE
jgi:uncharacterized protein